MIEDGGDPMTAFADPTPSPGDTADEMPLDVLARAGSLEVRLARNAAEVAESQRLRFQIFYREMAAEPTPEMAAEGRDFDRYDAICDCLLVLDRARPPGDRVVGTYRLLRQEVAEANGGFYSADEYDLSPLLAHLDQNCRGLELGRSCVHRHYRSYASIHLLWRGIVGYLVRHRIGFMFGCASLPGTDPQAVAAELSYLHHFHRASPDLRVRALGHRYEEMARLKVDEFSPRQVLAGLPPLVKGYLRLGAYIGDGAVIDRQFGTVDVFIILPVARISGRYFDHFDPDGVIERPPGAGRR
jgi:putative hemolysin